LRRKALSCLREGRVSVWHAESDAFEPAPGIVKVFATVLSSRDRHPYNVEYNSRKWSCECREGRRGLPCAHVHAVQLVTTGVPA
jgi:hypothetical protein